MKQLREKSKNQKKAHNKRVGSRAGLCFLPEPFGSGFGLFVLGVIVPIPPHTPNIKPNQE